MTRAEKQRIARGSARPRTVGATRAQARRAPRERQYANHTKLLGKRGEDLRKVHQRSALSRAGEEAMQEFWKSIGNRRRTK